MPGNVLVELYRLHAAQCIDVAQKTHDIRSKLGLLDMARAWLMLADQGAKNAEAPTLVYETPEPRRAVQQQQQQQPRQRMTNR